MKTIQKTYRVHAPIEKVWDALVQPKIIQQWSGSSAKMEAKEGFNFKLWNGDIHGKNITVQKNKELVQEWFGGDWDNPSLAMFTLSEKDGVTTVKFVNTNVPDDAAKDIDDGWDRYYLGPIKKLLES